jgi:hypothetical protein
MRHRAATDGIATPLNRRKTKGWKDTAMLYVFNSANGVQIAWNNVLPSKRPMKSAASAA